MNITTNQDTIRPNVPGFFTLYVDEIAGLCGVRVDVNTSGQIVRITDEDGDRFEFIEQDPIRYTITEILANIKAAFQFLAALEARCGEHISECCGDIPMGRWVIMDLDERCLHLRESPIERGVELVLGGVTR